MDYSDQSDVLLARSEFTAVRDLRGHEVAFDGVQTFSHLFVLDALARGGLTEPAVTFRDLPAMQVPAEVLAGRLAAGHTWGPLAATAVAHGCHVLAKAGDDPGVITEVLVVRTETLARHHRQLREMMGVIWASVDRTRADESGAIAAAADILKKKSESLDAITGNVHLWNQAESLARMSGDAQTSIPMRLALIVEQFRKRGQLPPDFSGSTDFAVGILISEPCPIRHRRT